MGVAKKLIVGKEEAREKLYRGIKILADTVGSTLGAKGQTVLYQFDNEVDGVPLVTKDGVTVASQIFLDDPVENLGAQLIKESAKNTVKKAGDGTTTSTVLTHAILSESGMNDDIDFIKGLGDAKDAVLDYMDKESVDVDLKMQQYVAKISTNNDEFLGSLVSEAIDKAGENGTVRWEVNQESSKTCVEVEAGAMIPSGLVDIQFINDQRQQMMVHDNPYIFVSTMKIQDIEQLKGITKIALEEKRPLIYIADFEPRVASQILMNVHKNKYALGIIRTPSFGPLRQEMLQDIADLVGATLHGGHLGDDTDSLDETFLGTCLQVSSSQSDTVLRFADKPDLTDKVEGIKRQIEGDETSMRKTQLKARLAMLAGAIGTIKVWAPSEIELKEKYDRVEDAVYAVYAAKEEGILPGGGVALRNAGSSLGIKKDDSNYSKGWNAMVKAINSPFDKILSNAGLPIPKVLKKGFGVNVLTGEKVDMIKAGIIDPVKVTKSALLNAVSIAKTILGTNSVICNIEK